MRAREADALDASDVVDVRQEIGEVARRVVGRRVVIDDLAEELNLLATGAHGVADVGKDVRLAAHPFVAARVRHDAERAVVVAAFDDRDVGLHGIGPVRDAQRKRHVVQRRDVDGRERRGRRLLDQHRQHLQPLRAEDDVDHAAVGLLEQRLPFLLRDATGDRDDGPVPGLLLEDAQLAETRVELLLGVLAHAAGVDDDHVRVAVVGRRLVAGLIEQTGHPLRVVDVHLTAERFDEVLLRHALKT